MPLRGRLPPDPGDAAAAHRRHLAGAARGRGADGRGAEEGGGATWRRGAMDGLGWRGGFMMFIYIYVIICVCVYMYLYVCIYVYMCIYTVLRGGKGS